jgi:Helitron helicase-like domain at N-terminus
LKRISHLHPSYASLHYVLLFPNDEDGWHTNIPSQPGPQGQRRSPKVSQRAFHAYCLHVRPGEQPALFWGGKLLQQYAVDAWASIEQNMLNWVRHHQKELRAYVYQGLRDAAVGDQNENINLAEHGRHVILPSSHTGSEHYMNQLFQDSMAICHFFCKPDIFLTMTANPDLKEIQEALPKSPLLETRSKLLLIIQILLFEYLKRRERHLSRMSERVCLERL